MFAFKLLLVLLLATIFPFTPLIAKNSRLFDIYKTKEETQVDN